MRFFSFLTSLAAWLGAVTGLGGDQDTRRGPMSDEVVMRVPVMPLHSTPMLDWSEHKGPKCIDGRLLTGARLSGRDAVDFVMIDRSQLRARLASDCPALDFYGGVYLSTKDDRICAKRDQIRSRMGGSCRIEAFRTLVPEIKR